MKLIKSKHVGVILSPSKIGFDAGASTFGCIFIDEEEPSIIYLYYSGAKDIKWTHQYQYGNQ